MACRSGKSPNTPQTTKQKKCQFRDDFTWHLTGMGGLGHDFKAGINYIHEPKLYVTFESGKGVRSTRTSTNDVSGPISERQPQQGRAPPPTSR